MSDGEKKMKKEAMVITIVSIFLLISIAVSPIMGEKVLLNQDSLILPIGQETWAKTYGGAQDDVGIDVKQTRDGGYITVGITYSYGHGKKDVWLLKIDKDGNETWNKTFGGEEDDWSGCVQQTNDGGYIIAGFTESYGAGWADCWLIKTDANGNELWNKTFGGVGDDYFYLVKQTSDNGYIAAGFTKSFGSGGFDGWLIKTDDQGNELWNRTFGGMGDEMLKSVDKTPDGGYILSGETTLLVPPEYPQAVWLIKTDSNGIEEWNKTYLDTEFPFLRVEGEIQQISDGYLIAGYGRQYGSDTEDIDVFLLKTDFNGEMQWNKIFGWANSYDIGWGIHKTTDGGCIIAGGTNKYSIDTWNRNVWLIKTNKYGGTQWTRIIGGSYDDYALSVQQTNDGGYIVGGATMSYGNGIYDVWLVKTNSRGRYSYNSQDLLINHQINSMPQNQQNNKLGYQQNIQYLQDLAMGYQMTNR